MLNLRQQDDEEFPDEDQEPYSWFGDEDNQSGLNDDSNSLEDEEEEDEDEQDITFNQN